MVKCANCGTGWTSSGLPFCPVCGTKVPVAAPAAASIPEPAPFTPMAAPEAAVRKNGSAVLEVPPEIRQEAAAPHPYLFRQLTKVESAPAPEPEAPPEIRKEDPAPPPYIFPQLKPSEPAPAPASEAPPEIRKEEPAPPPYIFPQLKKVEPAPAPEPEAPPEIRREEPAPHPQIFPRLKRIEPAPLAEPTPAPMPVVKKEEPVDVDEARIIQRLHLIDPSAATFPAQRPAAQELPSPARPMIGPLVFGVLAFVPALVLPLTISFESTRVLGVLGFCMSGFFAPFAPIAWMVGLSGERRRREQGLRAERQVSVGRLLGQAATMLLVAEMTVGLVAIAALRLSGKFPNTFWSLF